ncbi:hypothetical protein [Devosia sp. CN2-171]|uniref:hypothetical protein n=1 Tax=Devosia sp. CN2-171 TaxID=3400909 RepID=UPI003BF8EA25
MYLYGYDNPDETPEMSVNFVLTIGTGDESDAVFNQMHSSLGAFVENSTIENDIEVEARAGYPHEPAQTQLSFRPIAESPWGGATQAGTSPLWYNDRF